MPFDKSTPVRPVARPPWSDSGVFSSRFSGANAPADACLSCAQSTWQRLAELTAELEQLAVSDPRYVAARREALQLADALDDYPALDADDEAAGDSSTSSASDESDSSPYRARTPTPRPSPEFSPSQSEGEPEVLVLGSDSDSDDGKSDSSDDQQAANDSPARVEPDILVLSDSDDDEGRAPVGAAPAKDTRTAALLDTPARNTRAARKALKEANVGGKGEAAA